MSAATLAMIARCAAHQPASADWRAFEGRWQGRVALDAVPIVVRTGRFHMPILSLLADVAIVPEPVPA